MYHKRFQVFSQNGLLTTMEDQNSFEVNLPRVLRYAQDANPEEIISFVCVSVADVTGGEPVWHAVCTIEIEGAVTF